MHFQSKSKFIILFGSRKNILTSQVQYGSIHIKSENKRKETEITELLRILKLIQISGSTSERWNYSKSLCLTIYLFINSYFTCVP